MNGGYEQALVALYGAFNARDIDSVLSHMSDDVDWPNGWKGGRVRGHEDVRDYWSRQWSAIDPTVTPLRFTTRPDGRVAVEVDQVIRDLDGGSLSEGSVVHVYRFRNGVIARMDIEENLGDR